MCDEMYGRVSETLYGGATGNSREYELGRVKAVAVLMEVGMGHYYIYFYT